MITFMVNAKFYRITILYKSIYYVIFIYIVFDELKNAKWQNSFFLLCNVYIVGIVVLDKSCVLCILSFCFLIAHLAISFDVTKLNCVGCCNFSHIFHWLENWRVAIFRKINQASNKFFTKRNKTKLCWSTKGSNFRIHFTIFLK